MGTHERGRVSECSRFDSEHAYADGFNRIHCTCGWVSIPAQSRLDLTRMHDDHVRLIANVLEALTTEDLQAELDRRSALKAKLEHLRAYPVEGPQPANQRIKMCVAHAPGED